MANTYNKIIYGGQTLIDLTADTIEASDVLNSKTFHDKSGAIVTGTSTYDADTSDATASASDILTGETAYVSGAKLTGTMPNNEGIDEVITEIDEEVTIPAGYHDGSGKVAIDSTEQAKLIGNNIRKDVVILGVTGTLDPTAEVVVQAKTITPSGSWTSAQTVLPDSGYDYLTQVTVNKIPYVETPNSAGGLTVTIG